MLLKQFESFFECTLLKTEVHEHRIKYSTLHLRMMTY